MRFSLTAFIRLGLILGVGVCTFAVWLGRLDLGGEGFRISTVPHYGVINGFVLSVWPSEPRFLNVANGHIQPFRPPNGDQLDFASCSPWLDDQGGCQLVGRWTRREDSGTDGSRRDFGVARYALPGGKMLDRVSLDVVPASHPCWYPGTSARVLYAGSDGKLYQIDFDAEDSGDGPRPRLITWDGPKPGQNLLIRDPVWSRDPRMKGRLVVTLSYQERGLRLSPSRLWWLGLSEDGSTVTSAGPMSPSRPESGETDECGPGSEERFPNLAATPEGGLVLAYLWQPQSGKRWQLRLAPVTFDPMTGEPRRNRARSRVVCEGHVGELTPFSADGSSLFAITQNGDEEVAVVRYPTTEAVALK